ncbi:MAG: hypothetical protein EA399_05460 [Desulfovibrionales bacterium]|nr:MAG: hypothetical protein EA399_05460 [Desulfovibrionales bacterium]
MSIPRLSNKINPYCQSLTRVDKYVKAEVYLQGRFVYRPCKYKKTIYISYWFKKVAKYLARAYSIYRKMQITSLNRMAWKHIVQLYSYKKKYIIT